MRNRKYIYSAFMLFIHLVIFINPVLADTAGLIKKGDELYQKGDFEHAALAWEEAITLSDSEKNTDIYLDTVMHLSVAYQRLGYHQKAISLLEGILPIIEKSKDIDRKALFLSTLGDIHLSFDNAEKSTEYLIKSMEEVQQAKNPIVRATVYNNIGNALAAYKDYPSAMGAYGEALDITEPPDDESADPHKSIRAELEKIKTKVLINTVRTTFLSGKYEDTGKALDYALLQIANQPDSHDKASDFITLSLLIHEIQAKLGIYDSDLTLTSCNLLKEAKAIEKDFNDARTISYIYGYSGQLYEEEGRRSEAISLTRKAIFYAQQGKFPEILYLWQWQLGRLFFGEGDINAAIKSFQNAIATLNPIRRELFKGYRGKQDVFNESVKPVYLGLADLLLMQAEAETDENKKEDKLKEARDVMELLKTAELDDFFQDECVTALNAKKKTLNRTEPHTALLYPIPLEDKLGLLLTLPDGMKYFKVPVDYETLTETVQKFRKRLQTRTNNRFLYESRQLYDWLIRPIEAELTGQQIETLVVAPDGVLRLIPFSTLNDKEHFLIEKYAIATIPAITVTDPKPLDQNHLEILLSGLSDGVQDFSPLPSVTAELHDIKEIMSGKVLFQNKEHNIENLTREFKQNSYTIVHFATHGVFGGTPQESFLLTYDNKLNMDQLEWLISLGRFRERQVELLTLSACQTALGNERAALGLAGVAVKAGVRSAIATLWYVDDEATSLAIREFYRQLKTPGISKAKALQNAQKSLISQLRYWHPLYWAPFLLIGNWM